MLILCGFTKNPVYRGSHEKLMYRRELPKEGGWLGQFADLRGVSKKEGGVLLRRLGGLIPQYTL